MKDEDVDRVIEHDIGAVRREFVQKNGRHGAETGGIDDERVNIHFDLVRCKIRHGHGGIIWVRADVGHHQIGEIGPEPAPHGESAAETQDLRIGQIIARDRQKAIGRADVVIDIGGIDNQTGTAHQMGRLDRHDAFSPNPGMSQIEICGRDVDASGRIGGQSGAGGGGGQAGRVAGISSRHKVARVAGRIVNERVGEGRIGRVPRLEETAGRDDVHNVGGRALGHRGSNVG